MAEVGPTRVRRPPPSFRDVVVASVEERSPFLVRVTLTGDALDGFDGGLPAASVRLLLPHPGAAQVVHPRWNGNEFLAEDGTRPPIRTLTPLRFDARTNELDVEIVLHGEGPLSTWAEHAEPDAPVAVAGTGRGYDVPVSAEHLWLIGDESALPAISTVLPAVPRDREITVLVEMRDERARIDLPDHPGLTQEWHRLHDRSDPGSALVHAVLSSPIDQRDHVWAAGEAAAMQRIRRHLFDAIGMPRAQTVVRGYWKRGRGGDTDA